MLVRDINGRLHIVSRNECKNDRDYYQKLVKVRSEYTKYYKSVIIITNNLSNHSSNDSSK